MYIFDRGVIDNFKGMTKLKDYIQLSLYDSKQSNYDYLSYFELQKFLINCFVTIKTMKTYWEGDIRHEDIFISAIPIENADEPHRIIAFKQNNNGHSFVISECDLSEIYNSYPILEHKDYSKEDLLDYFKKSYDLVYKIIDMAIKELKEHASQHHCQLQENKLNDFEKIG